MLIRTQIGDNGGAIIKRLSYKEAYGQQITTSTLLLSMKAISFDVACEARFALGRVCVPFAALRRSPQHLTTMKADIHVQIQPDLSDESWRASAIDFNRALVDAADNPAISCQLAGAIEAMQTFMIMMTFTARNRENIIGLHSRMADLF